MGKAKASAVCRSVDRSQNANPLTKPAPTAGRVAVPVSKIPREGRHTSPGDYAPDEKSRDPITGFCTEWTDIPFASFDVYKFEVYKYHTYDDYLEAVAGHSLEEKVAEFELSFDVQKWTENKSGKWVLQPNILQGQPREVAMYASKNAGTEREKKGFAIVLWSLEGGTDLIWWESAPKKENGKVQKDDKGCVMWEPPRPVLRYGAITEKAPMGWNVSNQVAVHNFGPSGSEGCATTPDPKYAVHRGKFGHGGLAAFEKDMKEWMNLDHDPGKRPNFRTARMLLPGTDSDPPYDGFTH